MRENWAVDGEKISPMGSTINACGGIKFGLFKLSKGGQSLFYFVHKSCG